jgi:hypothetical protein
VLAGVGRAVGRAVRGSGRVLCLPDPVARPAALEYLLSRIRLVANVSTRTTIMLFTPEENRSLA